MIQILEHSVKKYFNHSSFLHSIAVSRIQLLLKFSHLQSQQSFYSVQRQGRRLLIDATFSPSDIFISLVLSTAALCSPATIVCWSLQVYSFPLQYSNVGNSYATVMQRGMKVSTHHVWFSILVLNRAILVEMVFI